MWEPDEHTDAEPGRGTVGDAFAIPILLMAIIALVSAGLAFAFDQLRIGAVLLIVVAVCAFLLLSRWYIATREPERWE